MPISYLAPEENVDDILYTPASAPARNLGPNINLANPFVGVSNFGTKTVSEAQGDYAVDVDVPKNVVDYLVANNPTIADALGHSSTFVKTYQNVNGQFVEVDPNTITPQAVNSGNVIFQIGGKTGGPNRERVAQVYVPKGDQLVPVGEGQYYKGEHPDQALFDFAKTAAVLAGAVALGPLVGEVLGGVGAGAGAGAADLAFLEANAGAFAPGAELAAAGSNVGLAGLNSNLASNLTVGEAASAITNPTQIVTKPITNTLTDYIVGAINSNALAGVEMLPGVAEQVALTAAEKAAIKTGVGMVVNGVASELLGGDFKEGATGTLAGTILNNVPIPGSGDLLGTNKDVPFTSLVGNLATKGLDVTGISDLSDKVSSNLSNGIAKGTTAGLTTLIAGGNSNDIYRNTGLGAIMGTFGDTKIPGTKLTGDDALELIQDSFAEGTDATNLINDAAGKVVVKADVDPLDQFDPTGFFTGSGFGDGKKASVTGGSGADTLKAGAVTVAGGKGNDSINDTISDHIDLGGYNDLITSGSGNDTIKAGTVEVTGASDPCENPNQIRDPITGGCYDPIDYVVLGGSGNDSIKAGQVTVTAADCNKIGMDYDPIENKCVERVDISKLPTVKP